ncbi:putative tetratricopeptide-like helical domain superfamily, DYW domain-containing protein [Helianthus annuus]|uniref:Putative tetratricopeptide repeat (TPR)-like superfamily protein n=1 Tax=Helianthus annuus TaxID=4232 RepID=A0A251UBV1_HELAN|nr:putative tetratricopeptide-like helical domain superfamily, DYW domain-containing protein [Helianthus annuus]KAJ0638749.1 putative tetratricopeptide-like helical domain superfamily, DYW domain-containing protein [Helianthus annuus]KAJ0906566.1 putative tetratricopeptide-like helical domain superfamily, DYW domain-containing protein [Helianthus annuus]
MKALRMLFSKPPPAKTPSFNPIFIDEPQFISLIHSSKSIKHLQQIHAQIILHHQFSNSRIVTQLISSYSFKNNFINHALSIFRHFNNPNLYIFNSLIRALADNSYHMSSISYFVLMFRSNIKPTTLTFPFVLKSTAALQEGWLGMEIHTQILKLGLLCDRLVLLHLVDMYAKVGLLECACQLFDESSQWGDEARSTLLWNVLINGYCKVGKWGKAMELFEVMPEKYGSTWSTLINGLMKAGEINRAMELWRSVEERDVVSWTTMINGFSQNGQHEQALSMFFEMLEEGVKPNDQTIVCALLACAKAGALETGTRIHDYILSNGFALKKGITAALVDMYAKCGSLENASRVFDMAVEKDLRTWSVMIWGCAINGYLDKALDCFNKMKSTGIKPDGVVFLAIITACLHAGNVDHGLHFFDKMKHDYSIEPTMKHYAVIVDLYGRAGRLNQALRFIKNMPIDPDFVIWGALFSACRAHKSIQMAEYASEKLLELEPKHPGGYVFLSNVYAGAGKWQDVERVRTKMKNKGVAKDPGWSYIEIHGQVTSFVAGDHFHDRSDEIHLKLDEITKNAREFGYTPETEWVLHNIEEEEKEESLGSHSEKLALAFALISGDDLKVIRIVKNLKICGDCHSLMKHASKMTKRDIVVRDIKRFHHFKNGSCSCQDYW